MNDKVLLAVLKERQSAKGNRYLSGWLGKARVVGFLDQNAPEGETHWSIYVQTPEERTDSGDGTQPRRSATGNGYGGHGGGNGQRGRRSSQADTSQFAPAGDLDDPLPF